MTKKVFSLTIGLVLLFWAASSVPGLSRTPDVMMGKKAEVTILPGTHVGEVSLKAGPYRVWCEHRNPGKHEMVFQRMTRGLSYTSMSVPVANDVTRVECQWSLLSGRVKTTELHTAERGGERVITKILIRGENVRHIFE